MWGAPYYMYIISGMDQSWSEGSFSTCQLWCQCIVFVSVSVIRIIAEILLISYNHDIVFRSFVFNINVFVIFTLTVLIEVQKLKVAFPVAVAHVWNSLPPSVTSSSSYCFQVSLENWVVHSMLLCWLTFDLSSTFFTYFVDCMLHALEVSRLYVTLIAFIIITIIIIILKFRFFFSVSYIWNDQSPLYN